MRSEPDPAVIMLKRRAVSHADIVLAVESLMLRPFWTSLSSDRP